MSQTDPTVNPFKPAVKRVEPFRLALVGPSGSGKTYTGLALARLFAGDGRIAVLDTEKGSARKYAHIFDFDHATMKPPYSPDRYSKSLAAAGHAGYPVALVDSITHAWDGAGGVQEIVDSNQRGNNKFSGWAVGTPAHNLLIESMLAFPGHLIATMRAKTVWDTSGGKPVKVGLGAVQRAGIEYEFDVVAFLDVDHVLTIDKTRCPDLDGQRFTPADLPEFARIVLAWLADGVPPREAPLEQPAGDAQQAQGDTAAPAGPGAPAEQPKPAARRTGGRSSAKKKDDAAAPATPTPVEGSGAPAALPERPSEPAPTLTLVPGGAPESPCPTDEQDAKLAELLVVLAGLRPDVDFADLIAKKLNDDQPDASWETLPPDAAAVLLERVEATVLDLKARASAPASTDTEGDSA